MLQSLGVADDALCNQHYKLLYVLSTFHEGLILYKILPVRTPNAMATPVSALPCAESQNGIYRDRFRVTRAYPSPIPTDVGTENEAR